MIKAKFFKYKGQKYMLTENRFDFVPGFKTKRNGFMLVSINENLSSRKKSLELHRLITGRSLRNMKFQNRN
jgi:hypothetical protein